MAKLLAGSPPPAVVLVRLIVGAVFLSEGIQKFLFPAALGAGRFAKIGIPWPGFSAPFVGVFEIGCGLLVLVGLGTRLAAIPLIIDMLVAIATTKLPMLLKSGFWATAHEARVDWSMLLGAIFLLIVGGGAWSLDAWLGDECAGMIDGIEGAPGLSRWSMVALAVAMLLVPATGNAGPPYVTDDPEPVEPGHWELYLATQHSITRTSASGTAPHVEVNYGALPGLQLHVIVPLAYAHPNGGATFYGVGDIELGAKFRFIDENQWMPMVGTFPMFELPAGAESKGLGTGHLHVLIPLWLQKSFGPWTTYGGGGYWRNPGEGNRDFWYVGWLIQRRLSEHATLGTEVFYTTPDQVGGEANLRFNVGLVLDLSEHHHLLFSAGRGIVGDSLFQGYAAYQLTL